MFVVILGIVNSMLMSVMERVREIGTMLALGMRRRAIIRLFLLEGAVIGAFGATLGIGVGLLLVAFAHHKGILLPAPGASIDSVIRPFVSPAFVVRTFLQALGGTVLASFWPAMRASKLKPVEALAAL